MLTNDDKNSIKALLNNPAWTLLERMVRENANTYRIMAMQQDIDNEYRVLLFGRAQGNEDILDVIKSI